MRHGLQSVCFLLASVVVVKALERFAVDVGADEPMELLFHADSADAVATEFALERNLVGGECPDPTCTGRVLGQAMRIAAETRQRGVGQMFDRSGVQLVETDRGIALACPSTDTLIAPSILASGSYEEPALELMLRIVRPGDAVYDVGSNLGAHTIPLALAVCGGTKNCKHRGGALASGRRRGIVVALEPQSELSTMLNTNIALNGAHRVVRAQRAAAGNPSLKQTGGHRQHVAVPVLEYRAGFQNFAQLSLELEWSEGNDFDLVPLLSVDELVLEDSRRLDDEDEQDALIMNRASRPREPAGSKADNIRAESCPRLVKIDVEGMERAVLQGAAETLRKCAQLGRPPVLYVENNCDPAESGSTVCSSMAASHCDAAVYCAFHHHFSYLDANARATARAGGFAHIFGIDIAEFAAVSRNMLCIAPADIASVRGLGNLTAMSHGGGGGGGGGVLPPLRSGCQELLVAAQNVAP
jgi:hypothetical protein